MHSESETLIGLFFKWQKLDFLAIGKNIDQSLVNWSMRSNLSENQTSNILTLYLRLWQV